MPTDRERNEALAQAYQEREGTSLPAFQPTAQTVRILSDALNAMLGCEVNPCETCFRIAHSALKTAGLE